jgi:hypothetical protein
MTTRGVPLHAFDVVSSRFSAGVVFVQSAPGFRQNWHQYQ